eukprot:IDg192t1
MASYRPDLAHKCAVSKKIRKSRSLVHCDHTLHPESTRRCNQPGMKMDEETVMRLWPSAELAAPNARKLGVCEGCRLRAHKQTVDIVPHSDGFNAHDKGNTFLK